MMRSHSSRAKNKIVDTKVPFTLTYFHASRNTDPASGEVIIIQSKLSSGNKKPITS